MSLDRRVPHIIGVFRRVSPPKAGVKIKVNTPGTVESILAEEPDEIVVATGATPTVPDIPGDGSVPVLTGDESVVIVSCLPDAARLSAMAALQ